MITTLRPGESPLTTKVSNIQSVAKKPQSLFQQTARLCRLLRDDDLEQLIRLLQAMKKTRQERAQLLAATKTNNARRGFLNAD